MTPLQQHMIEDMSVRGLVPSTQRAYLRAVRDLTAYDKRSPDTLSTRDIQRYLCMLHEERGLTYSTCNTIVHGLRFFYGTTLGRSAMHFVIPLAKEPSTLPVILSRHDIRQLLAAAESLRDQTLLKVTYNAGLRASEVVHLHNRPYRQPPDVLTGGTGQAPERSRSPALPQASCRTCGPIGASIALIPGSFPAGMAPSRSPAKRPTSFSSGPKTGQGLPSPVGCIYSATPLPPISWKRGWISTPSSA